MTTPELKRKEAADAFTSTTISAKKPRTSPAVEAKNDKPVCTPMDADMKVVRATISDTEVEAYLAEERGPNWNKEMWRDAAL